MRLILVILMFIVSVVESNAQEKQDEVGPGDIIANQLGKCMISNANLTVSKTALEARIAELTKKLAEAKTETRP